MYTHAFIHVCMHIRTCARPFYSKYNVMQVQKGGKSCMVAFDSAAGEYLYNTGAHCRRYLPSHKPVETTPESLLDRGKQKQRNSKQ